MGSKGKLLKIYIGENERYHNKALYHYLVSWLRDQGISGVTVGRGIEGYGQDKILHTARFLELSADLPMVIEAVDTPERIDTVIPGLCAIVPRGLIYTMDVEIHKFGTRGGDTTC